MDLDRRHSRWLLVRNQEEKEERPTMSYISAGYIGMIGQRPLHHRYPGDRIISKPVAKRRVHRRIQNQQWMMSKPIPRPLWWRGRAVGRVTPREITQLKIIIVQVEQLKAAGASEAVITKTVVAKHGDLGGQVAANYKEAKALVATATAAIPADVQAEADGKLVVDGKVQEPEVKKAGLGGMPLLLMAGAAGVLFFLTRKKGRR